MSMIDVKTTVATLLFKMSSGVSYDPVRSACLDLAEKKIPYALIVANKRGDISLRRPDRSAKARTAHTQRPSQVA
jgi:hypothetical protein